MTRLSRAVTRMVDFGRGPVAVTLHPDGLVIFREKGRRTRFSLPIGAVFAQAVGRAVALERDARKARAAR